MGFVWFPVQGISENSLPFYSESWAQNWNYWIQVMIGEYQLSTGEKCTLLTSDGLNKNLKAQVPEKKPQTSNQSY